MSRSYPGSTARRRIVSVTMLGAAALGGLAATAAPGHAATLTPGPAASQVLRYGTCTGPGTVSLQLQHSDPGRIDAGFEVDHVRPGSLWSVTLRHNGTVYYHGQQRTLAAGSFSVDRVVKDLPGTDRFAGTARNLTTGTVCTVTGTV